MTHFYKLMNLINISVTLLGETSKKVVVLISEGKWSGAGHIL